MSFKDFKIVESIGKGSFASVYKVIRRSDNKIYALKRVKIAKMSKKEIADALNEIRFLASIRQKNIVGFLEAFLENNDSELCIVMEYCGCGDLSQKVERYKRKRQYIDEKVIWRYLVQALKALHHLHGKGICHRDLKVANTFLAEDGSIKIGDMNVSKRITKGKLQTQIGTPYYMSPEIWNNRPYDYGCDIWSLGCMIYELASLKPPFTGDSFPALKRAVTLGRYSPIPGKYSDALRKVISYMLKLNAHERPTAESLLRCPEVLAKLHFDDTSTSFSQQQQSNQAPIPSESRQQLIGTIKVPQYLRRLALPKPCYPDVRPNSPSSWTVAEQKKHLKKLVPPLPPVPSSVSVDSESQSEKENAIAPAVPTNAPVKATKSSKKGHAKKKLAAPSSEDATVGLIQAVEDFYSRRPLAPVAQANYSNNRSNVMAPNPSDFSLAAPGSKAAAFGYNKPPPFQPTLDPIPGQQQAVAAFEPIPPSMPPTISQPSHRAAPPASGQPTRLRYHHHHHRMW